VVTEACTQLARWRQEQPGLTVAVNVSATQLDRDIIVNDVANALRISGLDPSALVIEITETALMRNVDQTIERLRDLKTLGVQLAIDDFGTGYSSLAYLQRFPVDCLKIDRSFTATLSTSTDADLLVHSLVQLAKNLGLRTVAEGIENIGQIDHLRREKVDEAQGFLLSRPVTANAFAARFLGPAAQRDADEQYAASRHSAPQADRGK
jgi:EAL domain-containing protein (putative c-di-GMP-specific phosphodiesterase class I)